MTIRFFSVAFTLILFAFMWTVSEFDTAHAAAPRFEDYSAQVYSGRVRSPDLASHPDARTYRTRLRKAAKGGVADTHSEQVKWEARILWEEADADLIAERACRACSLEIRRVPMLIPFPPSA